jgi:hypothetical protein
MYEIARKRVLGSRFGKQSYQYPQDSLLENGFQLFSYFTLYAAFVLEISLLAFIFLLLNKN